MPEIDWCTRTWWFLTAHSQVIRDIALTMAAIIGVPLVIWRTWATHQQSKAALRQSQAALEQAKTASQQADIASKRHEQQTDADRQRRITESFARAIEQLGSEKLEVRLGGIYALARIARESSEDHWPIMETLAAFVRETAALPYLDKEAVEALKEKERKVRRPPADVQAALTTIGHRCHDHDPPGQQLNLSGANLSRLDLREANLEGPISPGIFSCMRSSSMRG